jgi:hypothetical protein
MFFKYQQYPGNPIKKTAPGRKFQNRLQPMHIETGIKPFTLRRI